ncbi:MAG: hypothetical protein AMS14_10025 [Planctomycetes bacterium DG_20]|nr:MAG: hypothetical protein AMS14_10025 [Planctomycetes bacterium DG_20]
MGVSSLAPRTVRGRQSWSARYFARRVVYPWELPSIMRKHIYTGAMGSTYYALINGIFFVYFGNSIGMSRFQWGVMGAIASFLLTAQLLSAVLTQRSGRRKVVWFASAIAARGLRILGILVSLWLWHTGWVQASVVLIAFICLSNFFGAMAEPPWLSWLADIIPERDHGRFWGRRSAWIALSSGSSTCSFTAPSRSRPWRCRVRAISSAISWPRSATAPSGRG